MTHPIQKFMQDARKETRGCRIEFIDFMCYDNVTYVIVNIEGMTKYLYTPLSAKRHSREEILAVAAKSVGGVVRTWRSLGWEPGQ